MIPTTQTAARGADPQADLGQPRELSVVIASRNRREMLANCLRSLQETLPPIDYELIVVDDASTDGTYEMLREQFPEVQVLRNEQRASWTVTNNQGVQVSRGRFYLLLNDDTKVLPGAIAHCLDFMTKHPRAGIVSPRILNVDGSIQPCARRFPDFLAAAAQALELHRLFPRNRFTARYYTIDLDYNEDFQAEDIGSTCWLLRRECYEQVGPFDEQFPPNFSDIEYNMRLAAAGWERWVLAKADIIHYGGATMGALNVRQLCDYHRGAYLLYRKHYAPRYHPVINILAYTAIAARFVIKMVLRLLGIDRLLQKLPQPHRRRQIM